MVFFDKNCVNHQYPLLFMLYSSHDSLIYNKQIIKGLCWSGFILYNATAFFRPKFNPNFWRDPNIFFIFKSIPDVLKLILDVRVFIDFSQGK